MVGRSFGIITLIALAIISLFTLIKENKSTLPAPNPGNTRPATSVADNHPIPQQKLTGISYRSTLAGNNQFTLDAASITLRKKRFGFLRFKLQSEAVISKGIFHFYIRLPPKQSFEKTTPDKILTEELKNSLLPALPKHQGITIRVMPTAIFIHNSGESVTKITSQLATISPRKNEITFTRNPKAVNGSKTLAARQITLSLTKREIKATGNVSFNSLEVSTTSTFRTDLSLNLAVNVPIK